MPLLLLLVLLILSHTPAFANQIRARSGEAVSVLGSLKIETADAYSLLVQHVIEDCLRPKLVDCLSIQQNSWITDSSGNFVLWAQNVVELAKLETTSYFGTFTFQAWNANGGHVPLLCKPESSFNLACRAPFYTDRFSFSQAFLFYSHISNQGAKYSLSMSNNFGAISWEIPASINCPCYIQTVTDTPTPWGPSPFELVTVGLDASSIAVFRNGTLGTVGPILVESTDGSWHNTSINTLSCVRFSNCLATAERSINLVWNSSAGAFRWSQDGVDEGVSISGVSEATVAAPQLPEPRPEIFLYAEFRSLYAYLTILDPQKRALGVDPKSGKPVIAIPNSSITHNSSEDLLIVNPVSQYEVIITAGGNSAFNLFLSKTSNTGIDLGKRTYNGTLDIGYSRHLLFDSINMDINSAESISTSYVLPVAGIVLALAGFTGVIAAILIIRRKRAED